MSAVKTIRLGGQELDFRICQIGSKSKKCALIRRSLLKMHAQELPLSAKSSMKLRVRQWQKFMATRS